MEVNPLGSSGPEPVAVKRHPVAPPPSPTGGAPPIGDAAEVHLSSPQPPSVPAPAQTYSEMRMDPATHTVSLTVRDAASGEVLMVWPMGGLVQAARRQEYPTGSIFERKA